MKGGIGWNLKISIKNTKSELKNYYRETRDSKAPVGYYRFQIGFVFAEYDLFKPLLLYKIPYIWIFV